MAQHTPGPWYSGGCVVWQEEGPMLADLSVPLPTNGLTADETEANCILMSESPTMLAALGSAHFVLLNRSNAIRDPEAWERVAATAFGEVCTAIAAAKGEKEQEVEP